MKLSRNQQGIMGTGVFLVLIVLAIIATTGYFVYHSRQTANKTPATTAKDNTPMSQVKLVTYTSATEHASFSYPVTWKVTGSVASSTDSSADTVGLKSPDGKITVNWVSLIDSVDGTCNGTIPMNGVADANGTSPCPTTTTTSVTPLPDVAGLNVASGYFTRDNKTFYAWMAVQGLTATGTSREIGYQTFMGRNNNKSVLFAIGGLGKGAFTPSYTSTAGAKAFLASADAKAAKQILLSLKY